MNEITCCKCGIVFGVPERWQQARLEDKETFWCPNGHPQAYVKSKADKLAEELSRERQRKAQLEDQVRAERELREAAERRISAVKGQITRLKKRTAHGVCPCCNRTFQDLSRHMATKHPQFLAEELPGDGIAKH